MSAIPASWQRTIPAFPVNQTTTVYLPEPNELGVYQITGEALAHLMTDAGFVPVSDDSESGDTPTNGVHRIE